MKKLALALASLAIVASPAVAVAQSTDGQAAQSEEADQPARIPFANTTGIRDWRPDGRDAVYIQDVHRNWYRAELYSPAFDLPYEMFIGIDAGPTGTLDKFGAIYVDGQRYPFKTFERVPDPSSNDDD
tara:strand:- start:21196 stop:21579 length:384 start_codon:yes stop_codon:yes gene_type:complete